MCVRISFSVLSRCNRPIQIAFVDFALFNFSLGWRGDNGFPMIKFDVPTTDGVFFSNDRVILGVFEDFGVCDAALTIVKNSGLFGASIFLDEFHERCF